ncbi:MAG TPA: YidB family protein [Burkholderiales bacterium]|nr:YidB family protein [Burkholderiales bacterium]
MALLDELLGGMLGGAMDRQPAGQQPMGRGRPPAQTAAGGGIGSIMMALLPVVLSMLASRGASQSGSGAGGGGLGDILGQVLGGGAQRGGGGGMGDILGGMLGGGGAGGGIGGLGGLLEQMQRAGYGEQARSWVGTGQNMPISPDVLGQIFGQGGIEEIARQAGLTPQQTSEGLSELLPEVVDHVTPNGQVPDLDQLALSVENLRRRMGA